MKFSTTITIYRVSATIRIDLFSRISLVGGEILNNSFEIFFKYEPKAKEDKA